MPVLPHEYKMTGTSARYLLFDSGAEGINRMFRFAYDGIDMLANSVSGLVMVPSNFALIYIFLNIYNSCPDQS